MFPRSISTRIEAFGPSIREHGKVSGLSPDERQIQVSSATQYQNDSVLVGKTSRAEGRKRQSPDGCIKKRSDRKGVIQGRYRASMVREIAAVVPGCVEHRV
jgi:hypothetical protein